MAFSIRLDGYAPPYAGNVGNALFNVDASSTYAPVPFRPSTSSASTRNGIAPVALQLSNIRQVVSLNGQGGLRAAVPNVIVRFGPITNVTHAGTTATITVATGHNIQTGERVTIRQVLGAVEVNGTWGPLNATTGAVIVRRISDTQFSIAGIASITAFSTSANSIVEVQRPFAALTLGSFTSATNLFTTSAAHNLQKGDLVVVSQVTGLTGAPWLNRISIVNTVPSSTTFTVLNAGTTTGTSSGGVVIPVRTVNNFGTLRVLGPRTIPVASITAANPAVYTTGVNHGFAVGDRVFVAGVQGTTLGTANAGYCKVRTVPSATTLTLEDEAGLPITTAGATITANTGSISAEDAEYVGSTLDARLTMSLLLLANNPQDSIFSGPFNA